jgi:2-polyprenyl-3-methyl-5-hydroxy-6-metoxy-1,4-benzoquinol methylase
MKDNIIRGNNTLSHWDDKHKNEYGEISIPYEEVYTKLGYGAWENLVQADQGCSIRIIKENNEAIRRKSYLNIGCAHGTMDWYLKERIIPDWEMTALDFSGLVIEANKKRYSKINWEVRDVLLTPIEKDYGLITCLQTIEHFAEGDNYKFLDNTLEHCEYLILATVDTKDDCFGEHISHYTIDTFEEKGYDVKWKAKLQEIQMPDGIYNYIIFLIKGKLN